MCHSGPRLPVLNRGWRTDVAKVQAREPNQHSARWTLPTLCISSPGHKSFGRAAVISVMFSPHNAPDCSDIGCVGIGLHRRLARVAAPQAVAVASRLGAVPNRTLFPVFPVIPNNPLDFADRLTADPWTSPTRLWTLPTARRFATRTLPTKQLRRIKYRFN